MDYIEHRLSQLTPEFQSFVSSGFIEEVATSFGSVHSFNQERTEILENALLLYLLMFLSDEMAIAFISRNCDLTEDEASTLFYGIQSTLPAAVLSATKAGHRQLSTPDKESSSLNDEIAEVEHEMESLHSIRTMGEDMDNAKQGEQVHSSDQDALLRREAAPEPSTQPSDTPRWGSE